MGGLDKLELDIGGRPVLRWAIEAMHAAPEVDEVIVVTAPERVEHLARAAWLTERTRVIPGGRRRQDSVAAGVRETHADVVLVHDAARPFVSSRLISRVVIAAAEHGAAIPVLPVVDALKRVSHDTITGAADRAGLYRAQTPQAARRELLSTALAAFATGKDTMADEAELLARSGVTVVTVPGDAANMKVTVPEDLELARRLAGEGRRERVAHGFDSHPFGPADGLQLGGLLIEGAPRLHGHSDGDVVLHALCDGLLAAAGLGDLGRLFPSGEASTRGIESGELVAEVIERLAAAGLEPTTADLTITAARPRLGGSRLDAMAERIAGMLGIQPGRVSVKATSGNLAGDEGAGRVISATCLVGVSDR
jgi:2-C-methyl-D-erythritol 4-phosphate cytidylyltransferase/2-C-methyl-D-erythritol 2,4-cyclodiphosphate synthase